MYSSILGNLQFQLSILAGIQERVVFIVACDFAVLQVACIESFDQRMSKSRDTYSNKEREDLIY